MIEVIVNRPSFEYDIHSLVKSFFPREDVQIHVQDTFTEDTALRISVEFTDETVSICLMEQGEEKGFLSFHGFSFPLMVFSSRGSCCKALPLAPLNLVEQVKTLRRKVVAHPGNVVTDFDFRTGFCVRVGLKVGGKMAQRFFLASGQFFGIFKGL